VTPSDPPPPRAAPEPARGGERARFAVRENRFVVRADLEDGRRVRAYLPNTARLTDVLLPGAWLRVVPNDDPARRTRWTVTRVWDGAWVALVATVAADLVAAHLRSGHRLPGWPHAHTVRREVTRAGHRFDLELDLVDGTTGIVEVKSLSRVTDGIAPLSATPSTRGVAHLHALAGLAGEGRAVAAAFVVQRPDVSALSLSAPADPSWVSAVRRARDRGVDVHAYACEVDETDIAIRGAIPVLDEPAS
jgi:sugar fermentation stimulation protein A